ncbi:MAG: hypothetical protein KAX09_00435 [Candidatus Heimdallarchaeota archaeon]|nr:hypothetical protein [Candidatus Heimdallarchaeota archaeon]MCK4289423.1 hypothetical protein [Candidatus Heimdallarchaeota archaeon]
MDLIVVNSRDLETEEKILYNEWLPMSKFIVILFAFVIAVLISTAITTSIYAPTTRVYMLPIYALLCLFFVLIGINYRGIQITLTKNEIKIKFGLLNKKTILIDEIVASEVIQATIGKYFGLGARMGFDSSVAFIINFGDAVKLTYDHDKLFVFSSRDSQKICNMLNEYIE